MRVDRLVVVSVLWTAGLAGPAIAGPTYARKLDEITLERAKTDLVELARREGIESATAEILLRLDVYAITNDTGCPGVDVDVLNATARVVWNIETTIEQKDGSNHRTDVLHIPYLLPNTKTRITVSCLQDYSYRSRYDYSGSGGISLSYSAKGAKNLDAALAEMVVQKTDFSTSTLSIEPRPDGDGTMLEAVLAMGDEAVAHELVLAIARTGLGSKQLGDAITNNGTGAIADEVVASMTKLPPAQQAGLARSLLTSSVAERWKSQLLPMIDGRLCKGPRTEAVGLWIQAQGDGGIPAVTLRDRIRERCKPSKSDGPGLIGALEKDPTRAGAVLDAVDPALFEGALAAWRAKTTEVPASLVAFLRDGQSAERFDQAVATIPPLRVPTAITEVVKAKDSPAANHKAEWVTASLDKIPEIDAAVTQLTEQLVEGEIPSPVMRDVARAVAAKSPKVASSVIVTYADKHSLVFDATKLDQNKVDLGEFLAFNTEKLAGCTATIDALRACARDVAAYKERPGTGSLQKAARDAVKPEFVTGAKDLLSSSRDRTMLVDVAKEMAAAGFAVDFIADQVCKDAEEALRYDDDPDPALEAAASIDPNASCIAATHGEVSSRKRKAVLMTILAIFGLVAPLPAGGWFMRRRYRKLQQDLPPVAEDDTAKGAKLDDRLGGRGLGRALRDGVTEAGRELAGSPAKRSLETVDDAVLAAGSATVKRAVKSGDAATLIIRRPGDAIYIVALPVKHPRPQVVQRYLGAPWPDHLVSIQRAAGLPVLALVVLCGPDATEASLLVGYHDGATASDPEVLLDAKDARDRGANRFRYVMTLAPTPAATSDSGKA
jgi:hypothetical protein